MNRTVSTVRNRRDDGARKADLVGAAVAVMVG